MYHDAESRAGQSRGGRPGLLGGRVRARLICLPLPPTLPTLTMSHCRSTSAPNLPICGFWQVLFCILET